MSRSVRVADALHEEGENIGLHRFALFTACCTAFLIFVGGLVTSTQSGLSVPDWPTTYGWNMFAFPFSKWVGGIFYEHSHRLVASFVGFLTVILAFWTWLAEKRQWVRWLAVAALGAVMAQGILGGLTVILLLPTSVSMAHACLAQTFFCIVISLTMFTSPQWKNGLPVARSSVDANRSIKLPTLCAMTTGAIYIQLLLGAWMRHTDSGLAIPDFPLAFGRIIPPFTSSHIAIHFAHRVGALLVSVMIIWTFIRVRSAYRDHRLLRKPATIMFVLLCIQLLLGASTVWSSKAVLIATAHVAIGALVLGTSVFLTLRAYGMVPNPKRVAAWR
ncbi:MAG TPA: heme A synthase [Terriglobia bacterium]|nr:heme A synthase [Terriglobia bacterium]